MKEVTFEKKAGYRIGDTSKSSLEKYKENIVGNGNFKALICYELITSFFAGFPGGLGLLLRRLTYRYLFREMGKGIIFGKDISFRCPQLITLDNNTAIDDGSLIDARGAGEKGIYVGENTIIGRQTIIQAKSGPIKIGRKCNISPQCVFSSIEEINLGEKLLIGANCYIGGGFYHSERKDISMMDQGTYSRGPVIVDNDVWLGAGSIILDNVHIGEGSIIGAGSVVINNIPKFSVFAGVPAKIIRQR